MVESKDYLGQCSINLPLNSNQAATHFEWKLRVTKIGYKKEKHRQRKAEHRGGVGQRPSKEKDKERKKRTC